MRNYAGDPTLFPAAIGLIDDSDPPNAANFNPAPQANADRTAYLHDRLMSSPALNWSVRMNIATADGENSLFWDAKGRQWLVGSNKSSTFVRMDTLDGPGAATPATSLIGGGTDISPSGIAIADSVARDLVATTKYYIAFVDQSAHTMQIFVCDTGGSNAWVSKRTVSSTVVRVALLPLASGVLVYAQTGTTLAATGVSYTTDQGATWHDPVYDSPTLPMPGSGGIILKTNGTIVLAIPRLSGGSSLNYLSSLNGTAWTPRNLPGSVITGVADFPAGLDWDATAGLWVLAVNSSPNVLFYTSPDGIAWTFVKSIALTLSDLACVGDTWVGVTVDESDGGPCRVIFSVDLGATWHYSSAYLKTNYAAADDHHTAPRLFAGPNAFALVNSAEFRVSHFGGLPPGSI